MFLLLVIVMLWGSMSSFAEAQTTQSTYDIVLAAKACSNTKVSQSIECNYKVGKGLYFTIAGVGEPDAGDFYEVFLRWRFLCHFRNHAWVRDR